MTWLTFIVALLAAPQTIAETRAADPRMQCELMHFSEWPGDDNWTVSIPFCSRVIEHNADGYTTSWTEAGYVFSRKALGL